MEWVYGRHLSDLNPMEAMQMTYMSCEAVTAGLVLTGLVHADPHEGNIMLADDGRLIFLDFGLMSRVDDNIMEAFASGILCVLNQNYEGLVQSFVDTGFVGSPLEWRPEEAAPWQRTHPDGEPVQVMADELRTRMEAMPGGQSCFGAMSTVLSDMGYFWQMYTPPYVILLIRTFLTLEGIAAKVDPKFNIYEVALPWAVERALSPFTKTGAQTLRSSLLTAENELQWDRVETFVEQQRAEADEKAEDSDSPSTSSSNEPLSARARLMAKESSTKLDDSVAGEAAAAQAAHAASPVDSLRKVLGSQQGSTLRRIARDFDSTHFMLLLGSPSARPLRKLAVSKLESSANEAIKRRASQILRRAKLGRSFAGVGGKVTTTNLAIAKPKSSSSESIEATPWPESAESSKIKQRTSDRAKKAVWILLRGHLQRQVAAGWRGLAAVSTLMLVVVRIVAAALIRTFASMVTSMSSKMRKEWKPKAC